ncbi:MAG TPA: hypothetical protein PK710_04840 [Polyangiaceae bacterium]|nr:hypothetical protein [Polyangiaceae bacterium]HPB95250.1 hypothetical protein [Polyangiaceae bacterium]
MRTGHLLMLAALSSIPIGCIGDSFSSEEPGPISSPDASSDGSDASSDGSDASSDGSDASSDAVTEREPDVPIDSMPEDGSDETDQGGNEAGKTATGAACNEDDECETNMCQDGVCCESVCDPCFSCGQPGHEGQCFAVPDGENHNEACGPAGSPCMGVCDGSGHCTYPVGANCDDPHCDSDPWKQVLFQCNAEGLCEEQIVSCSPFLCKQAECLSKCDDSDDCEDDAYCASSECVPKLVFGQTCTQNVECLSSHCADGVCCNDSCSGVCETCAFAGKEGQCVAVPLDMDPDDECQGDGSTCAGTCSGQRSCVFPVHGEPCGESQCDANLNAAHELICNGEGKCVENVQNCGLYDCHKDIGSCLYSCSQDQDCIDDAFCNNDVCVAKKSNASPCENSIECLSGYCEPTSHGKQCCNTACPHPLNCSTGECLCDTVVCSPGVNCVPWYRDRDGDTFGNPNEMKLGCENAPPNIPGEKYVRNMDDCFDLNHLARPGQTAFFPEHRGDGSFDYDCDGKETKQFDDTNDPVCKDCKTYSKCLYCGIFSYNTYGYRCKTPTSSDNTCGPLVTQSYKQLRPCGQSGTLYRCNNDDKLCDTAEVPTHDVVQQCR